MLIMPGENLVSFNLTVTGEVTVDQIPQIIHALGEVSTALSVDFKYAEFDDSAEPEIEDILLLKTDFYRHAEDTGLDVALATRAWTCLTRAGRNYAIVSHKKDKGEQLYQYEVDQLHTPVWQRELYLPDDDAVSLQRLEAFINSGRTTEITNFGKTSLEFVRGLIGAKKAKAKAEELN